MLKFLVVEDDGDKLRRVLNGIRERRQVNPDAIDIARDSGEAKRLLRTNQYDLMILDVMLPSRPEVEPTPQEGIALLSEILDRDMYRRPSHIVGLTAFAEVLETAGAKFAEDLWLVLLYEAGSNDWLQRLLRKIRHIELAKEAPPGGQTDYGVSMCVVTALPEPELAAVTRLPWHWSEMKHPTDCTVYWRGHYMREDRKCEVIAASAPRMGMPASAALAMKMITQFRPRYLAMVGILAGVYGECNLGDVIAADPSWDYGSGKYINKPEGRKFSPAPYQSSMDSFLRSQIFRLSKEDDVLRAIQKKWPGNQVDTTLKLQIGPVASGAAVIADESITDDLIKTQNRKVVGIDMEAYGVMAAADESPIPPTKAFCLKSVCDFADSGKNNDYQAYAAYTSAEVLRALAEKYLQ